MTTKCLCLIGKECSVSPEQRKYLLREGRLAEVSRERVVTSGLFVKSRHPRRVLRAIRRAQKGGTIEHVAYVSTFQWGLYLADGISQELAFLREV